MDSDRCHHTAALAPAFGNVNQVSKLRESQQEGVRHAYHSDRRFWYRIQAVVYPAAVRHSAGFVP